MTRFKNRIVFPTFVAVSLSLCGSSCKKNIAIDLPADYLIASTVFTSDQTALSAISGLYSQMSQGNLLFGTNAITVYAGLSADELHNTTSGSYDEFSENSLLATNSVLQNNFWTPGYKYIYQANSILEGLAKSSGVSPTIKKQISGEALFVRAFCYFYLVNLFGDVPYITTKDYRVNEKLPRTSVTNVYAGIVNDLTEASDKMENSYPSSGRMRPNKFTAKALLSRVYLYLKDYPSAEALSTEVIQSGIYSLVSNLNSVFLASSNEAIWQLVPVQPTYNTWDGNIFVTNAGVVPSFTISNQLLNSFEVGDLRKTAWLKSQVVNSVSYTYPYKYKVKTGATVTEFLVMFRLAEQYLIRAEARNEMGTISGALSDLNLIRNRAGLGLIPAAAYATIKTAIQQERRVEFFSEWGHRWFDLKRVGIIDAVMQASKPGLWQVTDAYYPIPELEIQRNPNLTQNPGY